jgi:hypothetical protein
MSQQDRPASIVYVDASLTRDASGGGYVARSGDRMRVAAYPLDRLPTSNEAEAAAALRCVRDLLALDPCPASIDLRSDNLALVETPAFGAPPVAPYVREMRALCAERGTVLLRHHCRGHAHPATAAGFLNGAAHSLAAIGGTGVEAAWDRPFDGLWRLRVMECHPDLFRSCQGFRRTEAAAYLGVPPSVVDDLLRNGHLGWGRRGGLLAPETLMAVREEIVRRGFEAPHGAGSLRPVRGRVDEPGNGFSEGAAPGCPVRAMVRWIQVEGDLAAVASLEGPGGDEIFAGRRPMGAGLPWAGAVSAVLSLAFARYPSCDALTLHVPDGEAVRTINGDGPWDGIPALADIDDRKERGAFAFVAQEVPRIWKEKPRPWQMTLPSRLFVDLAGEGSGGAWSVGPQQDRDRPPELTPLAAVPDWMEADLAASGAA